MLKKKPSNASTEKLAPTFYCSEVNLASLLSLLSLPDMAVKLLGRNIPSVLRMTEGVDLKISRRLCIKPQQDLQSKSKSL